jgi:S1-C subfamily serine protease
MRSTLRGPAPRSDDASALRPQEPHVLPKTRRPKPAPAPSPEPLAFVPASRGPRPNFQSVVKVLTVSDAPDYEQPWQNHGPSHSTGSGAIIRTERGLRVLTNGHVVQNQVFVEVRRFGQSKRFVAEVEGVSHECDLALLRVRREDFFEGAEPIALGDLPELGDGVTVCGYPIGGDRLSLTQGVVSRIEVSAYAHSQRPLLAIQIDAAVNSGNSGGPVFDGDKLIGVAFQSLEESQNIAYAIAIPIVKHFLRDLTTSAAPTFRAWASCGSASSPTRTGARSASARRRRHPRGARRLRGHRLGPPRRGRRDPLARRRAHRPRRHGAATHR